MNNTEIYNITRKLAKKNYYQNLYSYVKELNFKLFQNNTDFSEIQFIFLNFLSFYYTIFTDIYLKEIDEKILEHNIYEDAYIYYKNKTSKTDLQINKIPDKNFVAKESHVKSKWHFNKKKVN